MLSEDFYAGFRGFLTNRRTFADTSAKERVRVIRAAMFLSIALERVEPPSPELVNWAVEPFRVQGPEAF
jgi:hypothetical protein